MKTISTAQAFDDAFSAFNNLQNELGEVRRSVRLIQPIEYCHSALKTVVEAADAGDLNAKQDPIFLYSALLGGIANIKECIETMTDLLQDLEIAEMDND